MGKIGKLEIKQNGDLVFNDNKPFFGLNEEDRISLSYPFIMKDNDQSFKMWYGSTIKGM